jgi:hypothetical protein
MFPLHWSATLQLNSSTHWHFLRSPVAALFITVFPIRTDIPRPLRWLQAAAGGCLKSGDTQTRASTNRLHNTPHHCVVMCYKARSIRIQTFEIQWAGACKRMYRQWWISVFFFYLIWSVFGKNDLTPQYVFIVDPQKRCLQEPVLFLALCVFCTKWRYT